jgi:Pyruvate/2-oxoacid:ferredoxin oxidoreductase delta subunit
MNRNDRPHSIVSSATRDFIKHAWRGQKKVPWDFLHSIVYARWPYHYIALGRENHPINKRLAPLLRAWRRLVPKKKPDPIPRPSPSKATGTTADFYHGKVLPLSPAKELVLVNEPINLPDLEQVIPYVHARAIIQQQPDHILLVKCPCRMAKDNPCLPIEVCMVIGEPFASFTMQHYPSRARWITQEEACAILEREDARGRVHHGFFAEMMLGRLFAICNCCACCCTAMASHQRGKPMLAPSGYIAQIDDLKCEVCGDCQEYCQFGALGLVDGANTVDEQLCMGCGVCVSKCQEGAISLRLEPSKGIPLEINNLIENSRKHKLPLEPDKASTNIAFM